MKFLLGLLLMFSSISLHAQVQDSLFDSQVKEYIKYKKYMYIDFIPKAKIPEGLQKNFYSNLAPTNFTHTIGQNIDKEKKVHRLYLTTNKAGQGFLEINKGALNKYPVDDVSEIVYVLNQDTVKTFKQMSDLVTLKSDQLKSVNYKKTTDNKLIVNVGIQ